MASLRRREKLGYGVGDLGASLSFVTLNTWLLYFLINIVQLEPLLAGIVFVAGRLFDALIDPLMGLFSDRHKHRWGRKPFIRFGAVPLAISFALLWLVPDWGQGARFVLSLSLLLLFSLLYTAVQVPYMALTPELAQSYHARTELTSYRMVFGVLASLVAVAVPPVIVSVVSGGGALASSSPAAWMVMGTLFAVAIAGSYLIMAASVPEPAKSGSDLAPSGVLAEYRAAFRVHGFASVSALFVTITVGIMMINSMLPFFLESALYLSSDQQPVVLGTLFGVAILAFPLWNVLSIRLGKRLALSLGLVLLSTALVLLLLATPGGFSVFLFAVTGLAGVGLSAVMLLPWAMLPDVVEFDELDLRPEDRRFTRCLLERLGRQPLWLSSWRGDPDSRDHLRYQAHGRSGRCFGARQRDLSYLALSYY
jgi:GPH family glycoside/pentoside/hexuronide:cation symporter